MIAITHNSRLASITTPKGYDISGKKIYKLLVIEPSFKKGNMPYWKCLCDCGNYTEKSSGQLLNGKVKSCGCYKKQKRQKFINPDIFTTQRISFLRTNND